MAQERTEEPTPKKLRDARRKGEVWRSRRLPSALVLLSVGGVLAATADAALATLVELVRLPLRAVSGELAASPVDVLAAGAGLGADVALPVLLAAAFAAGLGTFLQVGPLLTFAPLSPRLSRLDPVAGARNLLGARQWVELLQSLAIVVVVAGIAWVTGRDALRGVVGLAARDARAAVDAAGATFGALFFRVGGALLWVAALDVLYQRFRFLKDQRMTKDEVRREQKDAEGDPHLKQERARVHREIVEHAALEEVRRADVLVVNPTHLAIALRYDEETHEAPEVVAKGQDGLARRMIDVAREAGVPVMRDMPLARALFEMEVGDSIPEALYEAVAAVLRAAWDERAEDEA